MKSFNKHKVIFLDLQLIMILVFSLIKKISKNINDDIINNY